MPSVNSTTFLPTVGMSAADSGPTRAPKAQLDQTDFLKLLTVQLSQQDPLKPVEDQAFIAQMAQFSALEQSNKMVQEVGYLRADTQMQAATNLIGRQVTIDQGEDGLITGPVDSISADAANVYVNVNGTAYPYAQVVGVEPVPVTTASDQI